MNVGITLLNLSGSNVNYCYVVFDALDAADRATKLATVGTRECFMDWRSRAHYFIHYGNANL